MRLRGADGKNPIIIGGEKNEKKNISVYLCSNCKHYILLYIRVMVNDLVPEGSRAMCRAATEVCI